MPSSGLPGARDRANRGSPAKGHSDGELEHVLNEGKLRELGLFSLEKRSPERLWGLYLGDL